MRQLNPLNWWCCWVRSQWAPDIHAASLNFLHRLTAGQSWHLQSLLIFDLHVPRLDSFWSQEEITNTRCFCACLQACEDDNFSLFLDEEQSTGALHSTHKSPSQAHMTLSTSLGTGHDNIAIRGSSASNSTPIAREVLHELRRWRGSPHAADVFGNRNYCALISEGAKRRLWNIPIDSMTRNDSLWQLKVQMTAEHFSVSDQPRQFVRLCCKTTHTSDIGTTCSGLTVIPHRARCFSNFSITAEHFSVSDQL